MQLIPTGRMLGARIEGLDLARPLDEREVEGIIQALGRYGVVSFPRQRLTAREHRDFAARFGELEINVASGAYQEPGMTAYSRLQEREFENERLAGYKAVKHQRFVGTGYFDQVAQVIASGQTSTCALEGSTEQEQFDAVKAS